MSDLDLEPFGEDMFLNTERRCPVVLLQDTSSSMRSWIHQVNAGLQDLKNDLSADPLASQRVEVAVVTFGPVQLVQDFVTVDQWVPPNLSASGSTPLGEALLYSIEQLRMRKRAYREAGIPYYRPWIWLVTDGAPTDDYRRALDTVQAEIQRGGLEMFTIGTDQADFGVLREIGHPRKPVKLRQAKYREMFVWLSQSLKPVSKSEPGANLELDAPVNWGDITT